MDVDKPDLYIIARCLDVLYWKGETMKKTNLQMIVGLNYPRFIEYLNWLEEHGLVVMITKLDGNEEVALTKKGVDSYRRLVDWIKETMQGVKI